MQFASSRRRNHTISDTSSGRPANVTNSGGKRKIHSCTFCSYKTDNSGHLMEHVSNQHTRKFPFTCEVCKKGFQFKCRLKAHQKRH